MSEHAVPLRYVVRGSGRVSYTVEGLESLAFLGRVTPETEVAVEGSTRYTRLSECPFFPEVFPEKKPLKVRQRPEVVFPRVAPVEGQVHDSTSLEELKARIARDPNDAWVHLLATRLRGEMISEGLTSEEVFSRFFARNRLAQEPVPVNEGFFRHLLGLLK